MHKLNSSLLKTFLSDGNNRRLVDFTFKTGCKLSGYLYLEEGLFLIRSGFKESFSFPTHTYVLGTEYEVNWECFVVEANWSSIVSEETSLENLVGKEVSIAHRGSSSVNHLNKLYRNTGKDKVKFPFVDKEGFTYTNQGLSSLGHQFDIVKVEKATYNGIAAKFPNIQLKDFEGEECLIVLSNGIQVISKVVKCRDGGYSLDILTKLGANLDRVQILEIYGPGSFSIGKTNTFCQPPTNAALREAILLFSKLDSASKESLITYLLEND